MIFKGVFIKDINGLYKFVVNEVLNDVIFSSKYSNSVLISKISGIHEEGKTNEHVEAFSISNKDLQYFPQNIVTFFPNVQKISIIKCGINRIMKSSLTGLTKLTELYLVGNELTYLKNDLFELTPQLQYISFYANKLKLVGPEVFKPLLDLQYANFMMNSEFDFCFRKHGTGIDLKELNLLMKSKRYQYSYKTIHDSSIICTIKAEKVGVHSSKLGTGTQSIIQMILDEKQNELKNKK